MAMFKISAMNSPVVFSNDSRNHHISVVVNGSVLSAEDDAARSVKNDANRNSVNKGRAPIKSSEDSVESGASSRIYLGGSPAATVAGSVRSSVAAHGTTSIRVSEVINRENQDRAESRVSISSADSSQKHPRPRASPAASSDLDSASHPVRGFSLDETEEEESSLALQPQRANRFPLVHQSRFDEETDGPRVEGSSSSIRIVNLSASHLVSVSASPVVTMVPGAPNRERQDGDENDASFAGDQKGGDASEAVSPAQMKLGSYVSLGRDSTGDEWLKNEVNLVPKEDSIRDQPVTIENGSALDTNRDDNTAVSDSNEELTVVSEESDVLAEGIKLRVSFGSREPDEMVSRSPDDGYHDDDTLSEEESTGHPVVINETVPSANDGIHVAIPVRLSDSATTNYDREMRFIKVHHVRHDSDVLEDDANSSLGSETGTILSRRGTIRGMRNHVRSSIAAFLENMATKRQYSKEENGRVVLYTTSMGVVRRTHDLCRRARNIMYTLMARFEERDVFMNRLFQQEVCERLHLDEVIVPQLFVDGVHIGNADVIERLNETGELRKLLEPYKRQSVGTVCQMCGDFRFLPCTTCGGSKKSLQHRHQFSEEIVALRCMVCDENGLVRCSVCLNDDQS